MATSGGTDGWHYEIDGTEYGPVPSNLLKRMAGMGKLTADSLVRRTGDARWIAARNVKGLFDEGESRTTPALRTEGMDIPPTDGASRQSDWGLASVIIGCSLFIAQSSLGPRMMFLEVRSSLASLLVLAVGELVLLAGIGFSLWAGIYGWSIAQKAGCSRALPMAGVVVSSMSVMAWLLGVITIIRAVDGIR